MEENNKKVKKTKKIKELYGEFKKFITRGNVLDMAVGVIIGSAFNAIVTSVVNILMSVCTWGIPGGINGLVTVLPAANSAQKGLDAAIGLGQKFETSKLQELATALANKTYTAEVVTANPNLIESIKATILGKYTLHGNIYVYNMSSSINWGAFINATISFLIIALTLFVIVKTVKTLRERRAKLEAKLKKLIVKEENEEAKA